METYVGCLINLEKVIGNKAYAARETCLIILIKQ